MESARCKAFMYAADTGSFTKAAERLNYTPSGVSELWRTKQVLPYSDERGKGLP